MAGVQSGHHGGAADAQPGFPSGQDRRHDVRGRHLRRWPLPVLPDERRRGARCLPACASSSPTTTGSRRPPPPGWWVVKYYDEERIFLPDFDHAAIRDLSNEFGLPVLADDAARSVRPRAPRLLLHLPRLGCVAPVGDQPPTPRQDTRGLRPVSAALVRAGDHRSRGAGSASSATRSDTPR